MKHVYRTIEEQNSPDAAGIARSFLLETDLILKNTNKVTTRIAMKY